MYRQINVNSQRVLGMPLAAFLAVIVAISGSDPVYADDLHKAAERNETAKVVKLLDKGKDVNIRDKSGLQALHYAARAGHVSMIDLLLSRGADLKSRTAPKLRKSDNCRVIRCGYTALQLAALGGHAAAVTLLRERGAVLDEGLIDWSSTYSSLANGIHVAVLNGPVDFTTQQVFALPPGSYRLSVRWLGVVAESRAGNVTIIDSTHHSVLITVKEGMSYTLTRAGDGLSEKIVVSESAFIQP